MKTLLKILAGNGVSLYVLSKLFPAFQIEGTLRTFAVATTTLSLLQILVRPVLELVLLPVNLLTLGVFRWVSSVVILWFMMKLVPGISVLPYHFEEFSYRGVVIPETNLSGFWSIVVSAFVLSWISSLVNWITSR